MARLRRSVSAVVAAADEAQPTTGESLEGRDGARRIAGERVVDELEVPGDGHRLEPARKRSHRRDCRPPARRNRATHR